MKLVDSGISKTKWKPPSPTPYLFVALVQQGLKFQKFVQTQVEADAYSFAITCAHVLSLEKSFRNTEGVRISTRC